MAMRSISLLIKPSSHLCNIDCAHCFYKRVKDIYPEKRPLMDNATLTALVRKTLQLGFEQTTFCWQGGEPTLMGLDFFREAVRLQKLYATSGQTIGNSLQTNGILIDDAWAEFLADSRFLVGLSLEGPEDLHDRYRKLASGKGTFERVMKTVELLRDHRVEFNILTLLTDANVRQPERVYRFLRENGFSHLQFIPCFEKDPVTGEALPFSISGEELGRFHCALFDLWLEDGFPEVSIRVFDDILAYFIDGVLLSCNWHSECSSYLVVEHNGDVYPCDFFVYPEWKLGNVVEDSYRQIVDNPLRHRFAELKTNISEDCGECRWLSFCHGDCTKFRADESGGYGDASALCSARKMLFEHIEPHLEDIRQKVLAIRRENRPRIHYPGVGRNAPCPCGSGLKYKKCCGR